MRSVVGVRDFSLAALLCFPIVVPTSGCVPNIGVDAHAPVGDLRVIAPAGGGRLRVSWTLPAGTTSAKVLRTDGACATIVDAEEADARVVVGDAVEDAGLTNGTAYCYTVFAIHDGGASFSRPQSAHGTPRDTLPPPGITDLALQSLRDGGGVVATFSVPPSDAVDLLVTADGVGTDVVQRLNSSPLTLAPLANGDEVTVSLATRDAAGNVGPAAVATTVVDVTGPAPARSLTLTALSSGAVDVVAAFDQELPGDVVRAVWRDDGRAPTSIDDGTAVTMTDDGPGHASATLLRLRSGVPVDVAVFVVGDHGDGVSSAPVVGRVTPDDREPPRSIQLSAFTRDDGVTTLRFSPGQTQDHYLMLRRDDTAPEALDDPDAVVLGDVDTATGRFVDATAPRGRTVGYLLAGVDDAGNESAVDGAQALVAVGAVVPGTTNRAVLPGLFLPTVTPTTATLGDDLVIAGATDGASVDGEGVSGDFVVRLDSAGASRWVRSTGDSFAGRRLVDVAVLRDGSIALALSSPGMTFTPWDTGGERASIECAGGSGRCTQVLILDPDTGLLRASWVRFDTRDVIDIAAAGDGFAVFTGDALSFVDGDGHDRFDIDVLDDALAIAATDDGFVVHGTLADPAGAPRHVVARVDGVTGAVVSSTVVSAALRPVAVAASGTTIGALVDSAGAVEAIPGDAATRVPAGLSLLLLGERNVSLSLGPAGEPASFENAALLGADDLFVVAGIANGSLRVGQLETTASDERVAVFGVDGAGRCRWGARLFAVTHFMEPIAPPIALALSADHRRVTLDAVSTINGLVDGGSDRRLLVDLPLP